MSEQESLMEMIGRAGVEDAPQEDELALVTHLAQRQLELLGPGITKGPTGEAIQGLRDWGKAQKITANPMLRSYSIGMLIGALVEQLAEYRNISEVKLPEAMAAVGGVGLSEFKLANGYTVTIADDIRAAVKADKWPEIKEWLEERGLVDIIKDEMTFMLDPQDATRFDCTTPIGEWLLEQAKGMELVEEDVEDMTVGTAIGVFARINGQTAKEKMSINAQTLKATVKAERKKGVEFPIDLFSIQEAKKALVVPPKKPTK